MLAELHGPGLVGRELGRQYVAVAIGAAVGPEALALLTDSTRSYVPVQVSLLICGLVAAGLLVPLATKTTTDRTTTKRHDVTGSSSPTRLSVETGRLLASLAPPFRIRPAVELELTDHTYLPKADAWRSDWIATVAVPGMLAYRRLIGHDAVETFCAIGTGAGLDALAAIEVFGPKRVLLTDIHEDVVTSACANVTRNLTDPDSVQVDGAVGSLADPLVADGGQFDLIYENLPNIPAPPHVELTAQQATSSFFAPIPGPVPDIVKQHLLEMHFRLLRDVRSLLSERGRVLCSIGCRVPLANIFEMVHDAGYLPSLVLYSWKLQSEPQEVLSGYHGVPLGRARVPEPFARPPIRRLSPGRSRSCIWQQPGPEPARRPSHRTPSCSRLDADR